MCILLLILQVAVATEEFAQVGLHVPVICSARLFSTLIVRTELRVCLGCSRLRWCARWHILGVIAGASSV